MSCSELFVAPTAVLSGASDINGGGPRMNTDGSAVDSSADCTGAANQITNNLGAWTDVQTDDVLCSITDGQKESYRATNVAGAVITCDRNLVTEYTNRPVRVGGALATPLRAVQIVHPTYHGGTNGAPRINIYAGTYQVGAALTPLYDGAHDIPLTCRGVASWSVSGTTVTITEATTPCVLFDAKGDDYQVLYTDKAYWIWEFLEFDGNVGGTPQNQYATHCHDNASCNIFRRCRVKNAGSIGFYTNAFGTLYSGCELSTWGEAAATAGMVFAGSASGSSAWGCNVHDGTGRCFQSAAPGTQIAYSLLHGASSHGIQLNDQGAENTTFIDHCVIRGNGGSGILIANATEGQSAHIRNAIIAGNGAYGIAGHATGKGQASLEGVAFHGNVTDEVDGNVVVYEPGGRLSLSNDPFVDAANGDFRLNPDYVELLGAGQPDYFLSGGVLTPWQSYPDIGAVHRIPRGRRTVVRVG